MLKCKHCRNEINVGQKAVLVRARGKRLLYRAYVHQICPAVRRMPRNMFTKLVGV